MTPRCGDRGLLFLARLIYGRRREARVKVRAHLELRRADPAEVGGPVPRGRCRGEMRQGGESVRAPPGNLTGLSRKRAGRIGPGARRSGVIESRGGARGFVR